MQSLFYIAIFLLTAILVFAFTYQKIENFSMEQENFMESVSKFLTLKDIQELERIAEEKRIAESIYMIALTGDIMLDRGVESKIYKNNEDWTLPFHNIADFLNEKDLVFGNLEGSVSSLGSDTGKKYSFRHNPKILEGLNFAGFDIVSLANNHIMDYGRIALCDSLKNLKEVNIASVGVGCNKEEAEKPFITELGNTKIGFLAFTGFYKGAFALENRAGFSHYDLDNMKEQVRKLKEEEKVDLVFLSLHWGVEYKTHSNEVQQKLARTLIDSGVDVIVGHHPHVAQEIEEYNDGYILYSLGNFIFDQSWSEETMKGLLVEVKIQNREVIDVISHRTQLNRDFQVGILSSAF